REMMAGMTDGKMPKGMDKMLGDMGGGQQGLPKAPKKKKRRRKKKVVRRRGRRRKKKRRKKKK
ncbi:MAG: hypothetical protein L0J18_13860, partial [Tetragenococcus koreensis]|nr:hypothetical protein [Tetragenococcus koreensis]